MTVCKHEQHHNIIYPAVCNYANASGGLYTNEIVAATGLDKQIVCAWLKANGYEKYGGHVSRYWRKVPA